MNEESTNSNERARGGAPPARGTRARRQYGHLLAEAHPRNLFNNTVDQPVPEELLDLLRRIDARVHQA